MAITKLVGSSVRRREDRRLLRGAGRFVADISLPDMLHMAIVRASRPHAILKSIERSVAVAQDGVVLVLDGAEIAAGVHPLPSIDLFPESKPALMRALAVDRVRYVGEPLAIVVATNLEMARSAAKAVQVEYEDLPVVLDLEEAVRDATLLYPEHETNVANVCRQEVGDVDLAFAEAQHVMEAEFRIHRAAPAPMETRGAVAEPDPEGPRFTLYTSTQFPHLVRAFLSGVLGLPPADIRVVAPDVGGGFGAKCEFYPEEVLAVVACLRLKRPVRWIETRSESFLATTQAREQIHRVRAAYDSNGIVSAIELNSMTSNGAAMATLSTTPASISSAMFRGPYRIPNYRAKSLSVLTNKTPLAVYRGAGHPQAVLCMEQMMDRIARELGMDRIELRQRNMLGPAELPSDRGTEIVLAGKVIYDSGDYPEALCRAAALFNYRERQAKQASARAQGRIVGLGIACLVEETAIGPYESGYVKVEPSGTVTVLTGASPHGQGTATAIAQLVADELQMSLDCIFVKHGDTDVVADGLGTFASRGGAVGGAAARLAARRVKEKALTIAAEMLGTAEAELEWSEGGARLRNTRTRPVSLAAIARHAAEKPLSPGLTSLEEKENHQVPGIAFANGVHMAEVEIDPETGVLRVTHYAAVHDCGTVINPMIVEGQVHGGVAQGLGGTLFEEVRYDDAGYPLTTGFLNYLLPTAGDMPPIRSGSMCSPSPLNPFGMKGAGEGGTVGGVGSITSAIADALAPLGIALSSDGPFTPPTLLRLIRSAPVARV
jgi:aerobic carbon-monoxide dehydrogenase large subunit